MAKKPAAGKSTWTDKLTFQNIGIAAVVYFGLQVFGVFHLYGPYWGRVVDAETGQPIENAGVLAKYVRYVPILSGPETKGIQETFTDESGYFFLWPRLVLDMPFPFFIFKSAPDLAFVKGRYNVAGTEFLGSEEENLCTVYGIARRTPTILGPMIIRLEKLQPEFSEYRNYEHDLSDSTFNLGPSGFAGIILGLMKPNYSTKFSELVDQEERWVEQVMEEIEKSELDTRKRQKGETE